MQDRDLLVFIANDAASEDINLQCAHLVVNMYYSLTTYQQCCHPLPEFKNFDKTEKSHA